MLYKHGNKWMAKFKFQGKIIRKSTKTGDKDLARRIEGKIKEELVCGHWGILQPKSKISLEDFLRENFLPSVEGRSRFSSMTTRYYNNGAKMLSASELGNLNIDEITDQHAGRFASRNLHLSPSTVNCGLRTLRRALNLAAEWRVMDRAPKIRLVNGERQRERVLTEAEERAYLSACRQPWRDIATIILGTGMRPGEVHVLRWENVPIEEERGLIKILTGKSKAARRSLPMVPGVLEALKRRHEESGKPARGWVFPADTESGHTDEGSLKRAHSDALRDSGVDPFPPYILRHTLLSELGMSGCDAFTLAVIAGHDSIRMTQRYCHPQRDAIERAFAKISARVRKDDRQCRPGSVDQYIPSPPSTSTWFSFKNPIFNTGADVGPLFRFLMVKLSDTDFAEKKEGKSNVDL